MAAFNYAPKLSILEVCLIKMETYLVMGLEINIKNHYYAERLIQGAMLQNNSKLVSPQC